MILSLKHVKYSSLSACITSLHVRTWKMIRLDNLYNFLYGSFGANLKEVVLRKLVLRIFFFHIVMRSIELHVVQFNLLQPYIDATILCYFPEAAGFPSVDHQPIVGVLPQPCSSGKR